MRERRASLVAVGDELLAGLHPDLNSPELARRLAWHGLEVVSVRVVPDREAAVAEAVRAARDEAALVVVTGGLGPTLDDVTRHGVARALSRGLVQDEAALLGLEQWFALRGVPMPEPNLRQALLPAGSELVVNRVGTAPGFRHVDERGVVVVLPGPPAEMRVVFGEEVEPWLVASGRAAAPLEERRFHLCGLSESVFAQSAGAWMDRDAAPRMGCSVKKGVLSVVIRDLAGDPAALERRAQEVRGRFGEWIFSERDARLEHVLGELCLSTGTSIALAESCTGGMVGALLTRVPGISAVFGRGFVTYADEAKVEELGVPAELLARHGAVSREVAEAMALGAAAAAGADLALSVTGVAGPGGGTEEKPVGEVWIATAFRSSARARRRRLPPGEREWIRTLAARHALFDALRRVEEETARRPVAAVWPPAD